MIELTLPLGDAAVRGLHVGDPVSLHGVMVTGRDAAHKWLVETFIRKTRPPQDDDAQALEALTPLALGVELRVRDGRGANPWASRPQRTATARDVAKRYPDVEFEDRIVDNMCMQLVQKPELYDVLVLPNLYGDILSDLAAGLVGGLGVAPGANIGETMAIFEATHGTAPKYAGQDKVNPGSVILSGVMMFEYLGWNEAAELIVKALEKTISQKKVTYDFHRQMEGATLLKCSEFGQAIVGNM